jgi:hypothetical protein
MTMGTLRQEAGLFGHYLIGKAPTEAAAELYVRAMENFSGTVSRRDERLLGIVRRRPWLLGLVDAGLCWTDGASDVRRRLYVMLSILETAPEFHDDFLPKQRDGWYLLVIGWTGVRAVLRGVAGLVLVKVLAR